MTVTLIGISCRGHLDLTQAEYHQAALLLGSRRALRNPTGTVPVSASWRPPLASYVDLYQRHEQNVPHVQTAVK